MKGVHIYAFGSRTIRLFVNVAEMISMLRQNTKMEILTPTISRKAAGSHQNKMLYVENLKISSAPRTWRDHAAIFRLRGKGNKRTRARFRKGFKSEY
jgi:hypothetical protein